ncbi:MAG: 1-acyl-sn-glycerol-3-phosphate acyltransferase [Deltaproteobacteria bacterium]|nr:1-acyl-sn-glycerol-3-phosphate acyltransferase [Deltaproteobacteria bacterium]
MWWSLSAFIGTALYILIFIIPDTLLPIITRSGDIAHIIARYWARWTLFCSNVKVHVEGEENLPDGPAVYMANHVSHYDVFGILGYLNVQFRWTVKKELYRIPLLNLAMKNAGYIKIDRSDHAKAIESMKIAVDQIRSGTSTMVFPEGTRSKDGNIKYPFKKGGFHLAIDAGVPVVPISITGSRAILPKGSYRVKPGHITLKIGKPIDPAGHDVQSLMEETYQAITQYL